jgi:hypothetical protein
LNLLFCCDKITYVDLLKGEMAQMLGSLSHEICNLKAELYKTLDMEGNLNSQKAYLLSLKLDKLIYEYYCFGKKSQKKAIANANF